MSRSIGAALKAYLQGEDMRLAVLVKLTPVGGAAMGFTTWDQDVVFGGVTYEASNAVAGSSVRQEAGTGVDNLDIIGILRSDRLTDTDLLSGRYDGAALVMQLACPDDLSMGAMTILTGVLGEVRTSDGTYTIELRSLTQRLSQQVGDTTMPICRVPRFAAGGCIAAGGGVTGPVPWQDSVTVSAVNPDGTIGFTGSSRATGWYRYGVLHFLTGANAGREVEVKDSSYAAPTTTVTPQEAMPYAVSIGDTAWLEAGCDRRISTCDAKFANSINFRGEPWVPGNDKVLQRGIAG